MNGNSTDAKRARLYALAFAGALATFVGSDGKERLGDAHDADPRRCRSCHRRGGKHNSRCELKEGT